MNDGKRLIHAEHLVRKNLPFHGQVIDFEPLVREIPLFTDKLMIGVNLCLKNCSAHSGGEVKGIRAKVLEKCGWEWRL